MVTPILFFDWNTLLIYAVLCLPSGPSLSAFLVNGPEVLDIKIVPSSKPQIAGEPPSNTLHPPSSTRRTPFLASNREAPTTKENIPLTNGIPQEPQVAATDSKILQPISIEKSTIRDPDATPTATLTEPFNDLNLVSPTPAITEGHGVSQAPQSIHPRKIQQENGTKVPKQRRSKRESLPRKAKSDSKEPHRPGVSPVQPLQQNGHKLPAKENPPTNQHPVAASDQAENGTGWRQTPILEEVSPLTNSPPPAIKAVTPSHHQPHLQPRSQPSRPRRSQRHQRREPPLSGWATEDATDSQALPEFDFAHNLSKFDKRGVFDQLKQEDTTADEDRLISRNKATRKLRHDENVLGNGTKTENHLQVDGAVSDGWAAGESELSMDERAVDIGEGSVTRRSSGLRDHNQGSIRQTGSKPSSTRANLEAIGTDEFPQQHQPFSDKPNTDKSYGKWTKTAISSDGTKDAVKCEGGTKRNRFALLESPSRSGGAVHGIEPAPPRSQQPTILTKQASIISAGSTSKKRPREIFTYVPAKPMCAPRIYQDDCSCGEQEPGECPTLTALETFELEQIAISEFGLTEDMLTEYAGRSIAQTVVEGSCLSQVAESGVFMLAGNHKTGARVLAAGRHLTNRYGIEVVIYLLGYENRQNLISGVLTQLEAFERCAKAALGQVLDLRVLEPLLRELESGSDNGDRVSIHNSESSRTFPYNVDFPGLDCSTEAMLGYLDGLLGVHMNFEDLDYLDQEMYEFAMRTVSNRRSEEGAHSLCYVFDQIFPRTIPTPDEGFGEINVLALGAPKTELVTRLRSEMRYPWYGDNYWRPGHESHMRSRIDTTVYLIDVGIPKGAWAKLGTGKWKDKMNYGLGWTRELELRTHDGRMMTRDLYRMEPMH